MKFIYFFTACRLMKTINILRHNCLKLSCCLKLCQLQMCRVRLCIQHHHLLFIKFIKCFRIFYKETMEMQE